MRIWPIISLLILLIMSSTNVSAGDYCVPNPAAPEEVSQFDFLVGKWKTRYNSRIEPGVDPSFSSGIKSIRYISNGRALQVEWESQIEGSDQKRYGTYVLSFDESKGEWTSYRPDSPKSSRSKLKVTKVGETLVVEYLPGEKRSDGSVIKLRNVYQNISENYFEVRMDFHHSNDKEWDIGVGITRCYRIY